MTDRDEPAADASSGHTPESSSRDRRATRLPLAVAGVVWVGGGILSADGNLATASVWAVLEGPLVAGAAFVVTLAIVDVIRR
jgi:hypothetical protein